MHSRYTVRVDYCRELLGLRHHFRVGVADEARPALALVVVVVVVAAVVVAPVAVTGCSSVRYRRFISRDPLLPFEELHHHLIITPIAHWCRVHAHRLDRLVKQHLAWHERRGVGGGECGSKAGAEVYYSAMGRWRPCQRQRQRQRCGGGGREAAVGGVLLYLPCRVYGSRAAAVPHSSSLARPPHPHLHPRNQRASWRVLHPRLRWRPVDGCDGGAGFAA